jgi:hypothetical protein
MKKYNKNQIRFDKSPAILSKSRQDLFFLQKQTYKLFSTILNSNLLHKGVLYEMRRRCGKPNCKCAKTFYRHTSWYLSRSEAGRSKVYYIKDDELATLIKLTVEYKKFRQNRQRIVEIYKEIINLINKTEKIKTVSYWGGKKNVKETNK